MVTSTGAVQQQYIVHLAIQAAARDARDAVRDAWERVRLGGLQDVTFSVEEVAVPARSGGYPGEFLG